MLMGRTKRHPATFNRSCASISRTSGSPSGNSSERVRQEVHDWNRRQGERTFRGLVQPVGAERVLNGTTIRISA